MRPEFTLCQIMSTTSRHPTPQRMRIPPVLNFGVRVPFQDRGSFRNVGTAAAHSRRLRRLEQNIGSAVTVDWTEEGRRDI